MPTPNSTENRSLTVHVGGRQYPLRVSPEDEEPIRQIAKQLSDKLSDLQRSYPDRDKEDCLGMLLLIYAVDLYKVKGGAEQTAAIPSTGPSDPEVVAALQNAETILTRALDSESAPHSAFSVGT